MGLVNIEGLKQNGCELWFTGETVSANAPKAITAYGNATQITPFSGAGVAKFDGNGDYLNIPNSSDFVVDSTGLTIEFYAYRLGNLGSVNSVVSRLNLSSPYYGYWIGFNVNNKAVIASSLNDLAGTTTISTGSWVYISAYLNTSGVQRLWVNGILENSRSNGPTTTNYETTQYIGGIGTTNPFNGYISEVVISKCDKYGTSNFTPPQYQLANDSNTKLLLHFNTNGTTFTDYSPSPKTITAYGNATQLCSPCGSGLAYFDGSGDTLSCGITSDWAFLSNSTWTLECYFYVTSYGEFTFMSSYNSSTYTTIHFRTDETGKIAYAFASSGGWVNLNNWYGSGTYVLNAWNHVVVTRDGIAANSTIKGFLNGILDFTWNIGTTVLNTPDTPFVVGSFCASIPVYYNGYISGVRVSSISRYTANFTPSTQPFKPDSYTKLLLHMDGIGSAFYDSSDSPGDNGFPILPGVAISPTGSFTSLRTKAGKNLLHKATGSNYISIGSHAAWDINTAIPFAILFWLKCTTTGVVLGRSTGSSGYSYESWMIDFNSGKLRMRLESNAATPFDVIIESTTVLNDGIWRHAAIVFTGSAYKIYINSQLESTVVSSVGSFPQSCVMGIFAVYNAQTPVWVASAFVGEIADLMMFKRKVITQDKIAAIMNETFIY